jgi:hypothetical protein
MHYIKSFGKYVFYDDNNNVSIITRHKRIGVNYAQSWKQDVSLHKSREDGSKESYDDEEKENG